MFNTIEIDDSVSSTIIGIFLKAVIDVLRSLFVGLLSLGILALPASIMIKIQTDIDLANTLITKIRNKKKISVSDFNTYKNGVISLFDNAERVLEKSENVIKTINDKNNNSVNESVFTEGANMNYRESARYIKKNVNPEIKLMKKAIKEGDKVQAEAARKRCLKNLKIAKMMFEAAEIDDTMVSTCIGNLIYNVTNSLIIALTSFLSMGILYLPSTIIVNVQTLIKTAKALIDKVNADKTISIADFNSYKNNVSFLFTNTENIIEKCEELIKNIDNESNN